MKPLYKTLFYLYIMLDLFIGGICGGFLPLSQMMAQAQVATVPGQVFPAQLNPATATAAQAGAVTNPSSNFVINVTGGPIVCYGSEQFYVQPAQLTLPANSTNLLVFSCVLPAAVYTKQAVTGPGSPSASSGTFVNVPGQPTSLLFADSQRGEIALATIVCNGTACGNGGNGTITDNRSAANFPIISDAIYQVPLGGDGCGLFASTGALGSAPTGGVNPGINRVAANQTVYQLVTTAAANVVALDCNINPLSKTTTNKGATINSVDIYYGVQTTALTSITAPTLSTNTLPATGAAAGDTVATAGGSLTVLPASLQLATTTTGQCYHENVALGTPLLVNSSAVVLTLEQLFNQTAAAATQLQLCGVTVNYSLIPM